MLGLLAVLLLHAPLATAQEPLEQQYQRALDLFNKGKMEDACELFQQIEKEKPGYKETPAHLKAACAEATRLSSDEERLFNDGVQLLKQKRLEEAKQKFEQASKIQLKHPKYRTRIDGYLKDIEKEMKDIESQLAEDRRYQEAERLFNEGKDAQARDLFTKIERSGGAKADEARKYLQRLNEREDSTWNDAVRIFNGRDYSNARRRFDEVRRMNGQHKSEAENYLRRIDGTEADQRAAAEADQRAFDEAVGAYNEKRYEGAKTRFNQYIQKGGPKVDEARRYLQRIDEALKEQAAVREKVTKLSATGQDPKQVARQLVIDAQAAMSSRQYSAALQKLEVAESLDPTNGDARSLLSRAQELAAEEPLRVGLEAYFQGKYEEAEHYLTDYLNTNKGHKRALAYFFRGTLYGSLYFLSGEQDAKQKELALADFRAVQKDVRQFQPPKKFVSPKILSLYSHATQAAAH